MEPIDINLANKLAKISASYEAMELKKQAAKQPKKTVAFEVGSIEDKLQKYIKNCRKGTGNAYMKPDNADYKLTKYILSTIDEACMCSLEDLRNGKRDHGLTVARAIFTYLERRLNKRSHPEVGALLNKDHTSCLHLIGRLREYKQGKIFQVYMRNEKLRHLYKSAEKGEWSWEKVEQ